MTEKEISDYFNEMNISFDGDYEKFEGIARSVFKLGYQKGSSLTKLTNSELLAKYNEWLIKPGHNKEYEFMKHVKSNDQIIRASARSYYAGYIEAFNLK